MRFQRSDLPGIVIAAGAPAGMFLIVVASYRLWEHHGTPLLPTIAIHLAIGAGLIGAFSRFIQRWGIVGTLIGALLLAIAGVIMLQQTGNDGTTFATSLKLLGVALFLVINLVVLREFVWHGVGPLLERRDERRARQRAEAE